MTGTSSQIEWAAQIRPRVDAEFRRVADAFRAVARKQSGADQADTRKIILILEEKRAQVMSREEAGYFISTWQELKDQVRQLIARDSRYEAITAGRAARRSGRETISGGDR